LTRWSHSIGEWREPIEYPAAWNQTNPAVDIPIPIAPTAEPGILVLLSSSALEYCEGFVTGFDFRPDLNRKVSERIELQEVNSITCLSSAIGYVTPKGMLAGHQPGEHLFLSFPTMASTRTCPARLHFINSVLPTKHRCRHMQP
jgi:hypothetical protein